MLVKQIVLTNFFPVNRENKNYKILFYLELLKIYSGGNIVIVSNSSQSVSIPNVNTLASVKY